MPPTDFEYDVFISYSHKDRKWVRKELLPGLEKAGLKVMIDYRDFRIGAPSVNEMQRAVTDSGKTLMVLTQAYLDSAWAEFENLMVATLDPGSRQMRLIPLRLEACELPVRYSYLTYVDFADPDPEEIEFAWGRLLAALQARASQADPAAARDQNAISGNHGIVNEDSQPIMIRTTGVGGRGGIGIYNRNSQPIMIDTLGMGGEESSNPTSPPPSTDDGECAHLKELLRTNQHVLRLLERQKTAYGLATPPHVLIDIEDKEKEIARIEGRMDALQCD